MDSINKPWYKKWWGIILIVLCTLILINIIAFGFLVYDSYRKGAGQIPTRPNLILEYSKLDEKIKQVIEGEDRYWIGSDNPKITIVEFSDFSCSYCKKSYPTIRELAIKYKDDVKIIFRNMPLQDKSIDLAMAGECAGEQGLFWLMHDQLFKNQSLYDYENIETLAREIGVNFAEFDNCHKNAKYTSKILKDYADGQGMGVTGTPTWFINGQQIKGDIPLEAWEKIINNLLLQN